MDSTLYSLVAVILLLMTNAFFVAAEFALVKARGFRIESLAEQGNASAKLTVRIQRNLEAYLAACQLGITMASLGLGWVGEPAVAALLEPLFHKLGMPDAMLHTSAFIVGFLIFSSLHIVVGEQVPKTLAIRKPEPVSLWAAYPLHIAYLMVYPLNWALNSTTRSILRLFKVEEATHSEVFSGDELQGMVKNSRAHGELGAEKADMLSNMFEFDQRHVGRVMIPRTSLKLLDLSAAVDQNLALIRDSGHSRFPLIDSANDDDIVGIVIAKDLYAAMLSGEAEPWHDLRRYCRKPLVVPEAQKVSQLFETMRNRRAHMALVVNEYGELMGIITLEDLLEEIVGEIQDETDAESAAPNVITLEDGRWLVDGLLSLTDAQRLMGIKIPPELDANTLSGLCMESLGKMPEQGDQFEYHDFRFVIKTLEDLRVGTVIVEKVGAESNAEAIPAEAKDKYDEPGLSSD